MSLTTSKVDIINVYMTVAVSNSLSSWRCHQPNKTNNTFS